ncbi:uncharacterized protein LOC124154026 [Ischnura elegans]|uniref:uncharacterized protein LOC124154026 n=1 Tax=Ischnura elegans TaxID=197161 RepID=UPI001ED89E3F|nr:uncharacterized protein LOC124154026 [Ischnura elegans]
MEGIQESDSEKLSTKSSRKRQRKKQAAALEKLILASEAAGFCKQEPTENSDRDSVKIKGCLSDIVFNYNSVKGKECHGGNSSLDGNVNANPSSVCCEPSENVLQGKNQDTDPGVTVPHTKRRRNRKKALNSEACVSADVRVAQKNIEKKSTQPVIVSQKDNLSQVKSLLNRCVDLPSYTDKTNNLKEVKAAAQLNNTSDAKSVGETADRESTLSRSKRRRNRKKAIGSLDQSDSQAKIVNDEDLKTQIIPLHPPLVGQHSPQKKSPNGEGVKLNPPISLVSENTGASKTVQPGVSKSASKSGEISTDNILKKTNCKEPRPSDSELPKNIGSTGKKKVDPNCSSPLKEGEEKIVKRIKSLQEPLVPKKKESSSVDPETGVGELKCSEKDKAEGCDPSREIEKRLSSSVFQKISDPSKLTESHAAVMAEAKKTMSKGRPSPKGSLGKDKAKILTEGVSEFASESIVTTSFLGDEVDRASASIQSLTVSPQSGGIHTFISKTKNDPEQNFAGIPVASKGAPIKKIDPVSVEALDEVVVCLNKVKLENKNEKGSKDVTKSSTVQDSSSKGGDNVKGKPGINASVLKESSRTRETVTRSNHGQNIENKAVSRNEKIFTSPKLCTDGEPASKNGANVSVIKEAVVGELQMGKDNSETEKMLETSKHNDQSANADLDLVEKSKEKVIAEREARKAAKLAKKQKDKVPQEKELTKETLGSQSTKLHDADLDKKGVSPMEVQPIVVPSKVQPDSEKPGAEKSKAELRAERRAKQEAQRAAKAAAGKAPPAQNKTKTTEPKVAKVVSSEGVKTTIKRPSANLKEPKKEQGAKLLSRLGWGDGRMKRSPSEDATLKETQSIHPAIVQLSTKFTDRIVSGSNARCLAFVQAIKKAILDYKTPPQKELGRDLEARLLAPSLAYLESQRPHAVSVSNATKFLKWQLTQLQPLQQCSIGNSTASPLETKKLAVNSDEEAKKILIDGLDAYIWEKIKLAEQAVCETLQDKIKDGDVILTYGCSYLLQQILTQAKKSGTKFKVFVVDGRPWREGREMLRCLVAMGIPCSYVLLSAASSVMRQVNKVLLGAHALLSNGYVMSRVGVSQVALLASAHNVPVLVACETHKFCERVQSDSFVYNEMGEPDGLAQLLGGEDGPLTDWRTIPSLSLLNLSYDVTPPELVTAVATELAVLPCTSVPVVLRVRPAEPIASRH